MKDTANLFKLFSDVTRLRILMLLSRAELCVCQIMGVLGVSQPLVSRNLSLLSNAGLLGERRDGKLMFYCVRPDLGEPHETLMGVIASELRSDELFSLDLASLSDCQAFQKKIEVS